MNSIRVLPQSVADKIAAGEVAERPSAVVKELVENSIDAGGTKIRVEIKNGGISYICVTDNGCGIPHDGVETAFLRHATSKLRDIDDLYRISTMGFRGEALASICAVAEVEIITKTAEAEEGTYLSLVHGVPSEKDFIACGEGTTITVKNLFSNIPARMKFLKKDSTEAGYVADLLSRIALSRPDIAISYICDDKEIFATGGDGKIENVILKIYGLDHAKALIPVDYTEDNIRISGVLGKPELARGNRTRQTLFVNGRYVKNHVIGKVAEEAYRNTIMTGKFPFFVMNIELPFELVDVNVHPAKTEIKFANEKQIYDVAYHAVRNAIYSAEENVKTKVPVEEKKEVSTKVEEKREFSPEQVYVKKDFHKGKTFEGQPQKADAATIKEYLKNTAIQSFEDIKKTENVTVLREDNPFKKSEEILESLLESEVKKEPEQVAMAQVEVSEKSFNPRIIGQLFDTYILYQERDELVLIDQHAAHERWRFEKLKEAYLNKERLSQMLLTPLVFNLGYNEKQTVMDNITEFLRFGFEIEDMGGNSIIVHATPVMADSDTVRDLILELSDAMADNIKHPVADFEERALDMISCKYAIKANKKLDITEMQDLIGCVEEMEKSGVKTCPHGRPIKVRITKTEIEKMFKRIV